MPKKIWLSWSSGKDSAWTLHRLRQQGEHVTGLFTTYNRAFDRVAMHGVRLALVEAQARAAGLALHLIPIPHPCSNDDYERQMQSFVDLAKSEGVTHFAFGDLYLEEVRSYREQKLAGTGITPLFPLWGQPTAQLAREMLDAGLKARLTCLDPRQLPVELVGTDYGQALLDALPAGADPCGERGEFHSFCWDGPMFSSPIQIKNGERVERDGFVFADLLPADSC